MAFFSASKLIWFVVEPSHLLVWTTIAAALLAVVHRRAGAVLAAVVAAFLLLMLFNPVGNWALRGLENRYPRPAWPAHVDGILVLGEGMNGSILSARDVVGVGPEGGDFITAWTLAQHYPEAKIVLSGGSGLAPPGTPSEAQIALRVFTGMGLAPDRFLLEGQSRDTWENIALSKALAAPAPDQVWILVASAYHLPRAMAVADHLGWHLIAWPSDYWTAGRDPEITLSLTANLNHLDLAAHEWLGLLAYRLKARTS